MLSSILYQPAMASPIGEIKLAGFMNKSHSKSFESMRVFGSYALVYLLEGRGIYYDANRYRSELAAGDLLLLFPELAHSYGPRQEDTWSEFYIVFGGPVFDLWREEGLLDFRRPVIRLLPVDRWARKLAFMYNENMYNEKETDQTPVVASEHALDVCRLLAVLTEAVATDRIEVAERAPRPWLERACMILETNLDRDLDPTLVAAELGISYESFRKKFQQAKGVAPAHYRAIKRLQAAQSLLDHTRLTHQEIAAYLGFNDAFHFSKRFKQWTGISPRDYRRRSDG